MSAEAISIIETYEEEEEQEGMQKRWQLEIQHKNGEKQNMYSTELRSTEDPVVAPTNTTWSSGIAIPKHNLSTLAFGDPMVIPTDNPQLLRGAPPHIPVSK